MARSRWLENKGKDREAWQKLFDELPAEKKDIHFLPAYFDIYERTYGLKGVLFVFDTSAGVMIQPFVERPLANAAETFGCDARGFSDLESVYGYGGPLFSSTERPSEAVVDAFQEELVSACHSSHYVSEYSVLHPLLAEDQRMLLSTTADLVHRKDVVYVDLREPSHVLWAGIEERQRKAVSAARRFGGSIVREELSDENLHRFQQMYIDTMQRKSAGAGWLFPDSYFPNCRDCLGRDQVALFSATMPGQDGRSSDWAAAFFLICGFRTAYYHFSASRPEYSKYNGNSLLLMDTILWSKSQGYDFFHLGGGRTAEQNDSLLLFKQSFSRRKAPLYVYGRPMIHAKYDELVRCRNQHDEARGLRSEGGRYFPPYRRP